MATELKQNIVGSKIISTEFYRKERAAYIFFKGEKDKYALGFVFHPHGNGTFLVPASKVKIETREKPWPFFGIDDAVIENVEQVDSDRIIKLSYIKGKIKGQIVLEAMGVNGNIWNLDETGYITATLRKRSYNEKEKYSPPSKIEGLNPADISDEKIKGLCANNLDKPLWQVLEKNILGFNKTLVREVIHRSTEGDLESLAASIKEIGERFLNAEKGYLYQIAGKVEAYPFKLSHIDQQPEKFKSLSLAVMHLSDLKQIQTEEADEEKTILQAIKKEIKKLSKRIENIENDLKEAEDFEKFKHWGELLKINYDKIKKGMTEIVLEDVISPDQNEIVITLDNKMSPVDNIERYFKKYRKGREGLDILKRRLEITNQEKINLENIYSDLENNFDNAINHHKSDIAGLLPKTTSMAEIVERLPYRKYMLTTGLTIFVGKDGADNDRTTFEFAKPYELWFHAAQCPGSHVVIKYPNKSFEPSKNEITETAAIAAWFSKARNDSAVPVNYTHRKYVHKPRKAKPGLVTVDRVRSVMVEPKKPEVEK
ncbi:MAG: NFACT RNA binding domain-containing protein [bacterium]